MATPNASDSESASDFEGFGAIDVLQGEANRRGDINDSDIKISSVNTDDLSDFSDDEDDVGLNRNQWTRNVARVDKNPFRGPKFVISQCGMTICMSDMLNKGANV